ncbi:MULTISPECIES: glutathione S-transferase family protein [Methylorubrum]|jgi:glutathione S-transferase|uniref:Glutathione S-transferase n=2 Tax=Methylorubrum extorquens TaxID=408 RepID=C5B1K6_METEA|nr:MULTISPECIES: glutathione S-transferase family protein [Methylorubrum]ACS39640.1 putative glutathione S-transferase [Methylorubrum extorquens AM1]EHP84053.1 Glutathione S-transferase domain protein [Methylorubrum extorquens DSM 13060]MCP1542238.1 glutathione S-transferase [Methylorubrum extorquens]MCP1590417.1 glutathione S-transferase [Methylorubrum extorquens]BDL39313.1 glutathione S-transferase [Methylorubrum sp. GM97]
MITVFHAPRTRSLRVLWMLEEMGLPYEVRLVDFPRHRSDAEFMRLNPAGSIPVLRDGDVVISESTAIIEYLVARYGPTSLAPQPSETAYPSYLQYFHFGEASLAGPMTVVAHCWFMGPEDQRENAGVEAARTIFRARLPAIQSRLEEHDYLAGSAFTAADVSVVYALGLGQALRAVETYAPVIQDYLARCRARPGFQRALLK